MSTFAPCHCVICVPKAEKFGNRTLPLPCRGSAGRLHTSICSRQSPSNSNTRFSAKLSMRLNSSVALEVPRRTSTVQPRIQTTKVPPKRIDHRISSPARSFSSFSSGLKTGKPVPNTPTKCQPKYLPRIPSKLNQSTPSIAAKSTPIMQNKTTKATDLKVIAKKLLPIIDTECNKNESETVENCDLNGNTETDGVSESIADDSVTKDSSEIALVLQEMAIAENDQTPAQPLILLQENAQTQQPEPSIVHADNEIACKDDGTKPSSTQSKWIDEVLSLLNTGTEKQLSNKLATIGFKIASQIIRCRAVRGKFERMEDLQTKLGWSNKVYKKFLSNNFLD